MPQYGTFCPQCGRVMVKVAKDTFLCPHHPMPEEKKKK